MVSLSVFVSGDQGIYKIFNILLMSEHKQVFPLSIVSAIAIVKYKYVAIDNYRSQTKFGAR